MIAHEPSTSPRRFRHARKCGFGNRFMRREEGTASVEAVLWMPIFVLLFGLMVDTSLIFFGQSKVLRVVQDGNRNLSIGRLEDEAGTETYIANALAALGVNADVHSRIVAGVVRTDVSLAAAQLQAVGVFSSLMNLRITVSAEHLIENWEEA